MDLGLKQDLLQNKLMELDNTIKKMKREIKGDKINSDLQSKEREKKTIIEQIQNNENLKNTII